jgi:hypothetical protein
MTIARSSLLAAALAAALSGCCFGGTEGITSAPGDPGAIVAPTPTGSAPTGSGAAGAATPAGTLYVCHYVSGALCEETRSDSVAIAFLGLEETQGLCTGLGGTWSVGATCPRESLVGSCVYAGSGKTAYYYSTGDVPYTLDTARSGCVAPDEWHPG